MSRSHLEGGGRCCDQVPSGGGEGGAVTKFHLEGGRCYDLWC